MSRRAPIRAPFKHWCRHACQLHLPKFALGGTAAAIVVLWSVLIDVPTLPPSSPPRKAQANPAFHSQSGALLSVAETNRPPGEAGTPL